MTSTTRKHRRGRRLCSVAAVGGLLAGALVYSAPAATAAPITAVTTAAVAPGKDYSADVIGQFDSMNSYAHIEHLAVGIGPRLNGTPQEREGAEYIGSVLRSYGFQVTLQSWGPVSTKRVAKVTSPNATLPGGPNWQFSASTSGRFTGDGAPVQAQVVDAGAGQTDADFPADVAGKIVLVNYGSTAAARNTAAANAVAKGAVAVILAQTSANAAPPTVTLTTAQPTVPILGAGTAHGDWIRGLLAAGPLTLSLVSNEYVSPMGTNVIGIRHAVGDPDGSTAPIVMVGAHIDSVLGAPGAHDDASGNGVSLEFARVISQYPLDKEIRIGGFGGEEGGLLGAKAYVATLTAQEKARFVGEWQMDMVGTPYEPARLWALTPNGQSNLVVQSAYDAVARGGGVDELQNCRLGQSDHQAFFDAGIPSSLFIWLDYRKPVSGVCGSSGGTYVTEPQYHRPTDTMDNISPARLQTTLNVVGGAAAWYAMNQVTVQAKAADGAALPDATVQADCGDGPRALGKTGTDGNLITVIPHLTCIFQISADGTSTQKVGSIAGDTTVAITMGTTENAGQIITAKVNAGTLTMSSAGQVVALPAVDLTGVDQITSGALNTVTVTDSRGTSADWSLTGQVSDFTAAEGVIPAANLGWRPSASVVPGNNLPGGTAPAVTAGGARNPGAGLAEASALCGAKAGTNTGKFDCGAGLDLGIPGSTRGGDYSAVLTLTLI